MTRAKAYAGPDRRLADRLQAVENSQSKHESECAMRYKGIEENTVWIKDRIFRLECLIVAGGAGTIGLLVKLAFFHS